MEKIIFKKIVVLVIALLFAGTLFIPSLSGETERSSEPVVVIVNQSGENIEIEYEINDFDETPVMIDGVEYSVICIGEESNLLLAGKPDIPTVCRSIVIPDTSKMKVNVISTNYDEYENVLIAPSKGNLLRTVNPDDVPYGFGEVYFEDAWFPGDIATLREPYIIRDFRGQVVDIYPIQYNPVTKIMRFYTDITVEVVTDGEDTVNTIERDNLPEKVDFEFNEIYNHHFINFGKQGRYDPVLDQGNMLVIVYDSFWDTMLPFVEWKNTKGIPTEMVKVSEIGNANDIKTYITNYYNTDGLTFVLLAGDAAQVPTYYAGYVASDPSYSFIVGGDHYSDLFVGRFSAETVDQLQTQVERTIEYEKYPQMGEDWYQEGLGVASNQGPGDDGEYDDEHMDNIRDKLLAYTYIEVEQSYDPWGTSTIIANAVDGGTSTVNYCGHGSPTSWGNGGGFSNSNVDALVNDNMLPFITSVACNNGEFDDYTCFAEAWMQATNGDEPTGSIANFMSSKSQSWNPPMDAQDEFIDLIIETYPDLHITSFGAACFNGCMHMNDEYGSSGYSETDAWTVFGDPSVKVRTDMPAAMNVNHEDEIEEERTNFEVTVPGVEGALCALSRDGILLGYAYTDGTGSATITFDPIIGEEPPLDLVITAYNKEPYMAQITIITNKAPEIPEKPDGPATIKVGTEASFTTTTTDSDEDQVYYMWSWGDGNNSEWLGPFNSGATASATHTWTEPAQYTIEVKAKDTFGQETDWSDSLSINVEKSRAINRPFISKLLELFPIIERLFELIIH